MNGGMEAPTTDTRGHRALDALNHGASILAGMGAGWLGRGFGADVLDLGTAVTMASFTALALASGIGSTRRIMSRPMAARAYLVDRVHEDGAYWKWVAGVDGTVFLVAACAARAMGWTDPLDDVAAGAVATGLLTSGAMGIACGSVQALQARRRRREGPAPG